MIVTRSPGSQGCGDEHVRLDGAGAAGATDDVGFPAGAVGHVAAEDALVRVETGSEDQVFGDGEAAFVVDAGGGDAGAVDFGLEQVNEHAAAAAIPARCRKVGREVRKPSRRREVSGSIGGGTTPVLGRAWARDEAEKSGRTG